MSVIGLFIALVILLQIPAIQTLMVHSLSEWLTTRTGHVIDIKSVNVKWFDEAEARNVSVYDRRGNMMIRVKDVQIDFDLRNLLEDSKFIDEVFLDSGRFVLKKYSNDTPVNFKTFLDSVKSVLRGGQKQSELFIESVKGQQLSFSFDHQEKDSLQGLFDYNHFVLEDIEMSLGSFRLIADTIQTRILELKLNDPNSGFRIQEMYGDFSLNNQALSLGSLELNTGNSLIRDSLTLSYNSFIALSYLKDSVSIYANLNESSIHSRDLGLFSKFFQKFDEPYRVSGTIDGFVHDLDLDDFSVSYGKGSNLRGSFHFSGLPDLQNALILANIKRSYFTSEDLAKFTPTNTHDLIGRFDYLFYSGFFRGRSQDTISFSGNFDTDLGDFDTNISIKFAEGQQPRYKGYLNTNAFDIGVLLKAEDRLDKISFNGTITGTGFDLKNSEFDLKDARISSIGVVSDNEVIHINNIETTARLAEGFFSGELSVDDPELIKLRAKGLVDIRQGQDSLSVEGVLDTLRLDRLRLNQYVDFIRGTFDLRFDGFDPFNFNIDSLTGVAVMDSVYLEKGEKKHHIPSIYFSASDNVAERLRLITNNLNISIDGQFEYSRVYADLRDLIREYQLNILNNRDSIVTYYTQKPEKELERYNVNYRVRLLDINPFINIFLPIQDSLYISRNATIEGRVSGGLTNIVDLYSEIDTLILNGQIFTDNLIEFNGSKIIDSTEILASFYIQSENQQFRNLTKTEDLFLGGVWNRQHIDFDFNLLQPSINNYALIGGTVDFLEDSISVHLVPDSLRAFEREWSIDPANQVTFLTGGIGVDIEFDRFQLESDQQRILLQGTISNDPERSLIVSLEDVLVSNFNPLLPKSFSGVSTGNFTLKKYANDLGRYQIKLDTFNVEVDSLHIESFLVGDVKSASKRDTVNNVYKLNLFVDRNERRAINVQGLYIDSLKTNPLDLKARFDSASISFLEPFFSSIFSNMEGFAQGDFRITGSLGYPVFRGRGYINNGRIRVNYLNTDYTFEGFIAFRNDTIEIEGLNLLDDERNSGLMSGLITHSGFRDYQFNLSGSYTNLHMLNTTSAENDLFYGSGYGTGTIEFIGPASNMVINMQAVTERGTRIYIPVGGTSTIEQKDFINFVNFDEEGSIEEQKEQDYRVNLKGLVVNIDLEVTPDAYGEIIFDLTAGDIIRGRGNGRINMLIDTNGDFNMFGDLEFTEGWYNFTMYNIINKEFSILPRSKISWRGDPYEGILNIQATYDQMASIAPLLRINDEEVMNAPDIRRKYPTQVLLDLQGPLLSPDIQFDIQVEDYPETVIAGGIPINLRSYITAFYNRIDNDEQELKRQVFSLIILRKFSQEDLYVTSGLGNSIGSSVSEFISNQLSYWISQVDENLEIDVDLGRLSQDAVNTFQLRLSYTFLEGRLRVTRDGGFVNNQNQADVSSIIGDWSVEYLLDPSGKLRVRMYNKTNYRNLEQNYYSSIPFTAGFSIMWTQSFSEISQKIEEARKRQDSPKEETTSMNSEGIINREEDEFR